MLQKIRVHEVAKDLKLNSRELLDLFAAHGITLKNHMATLDEKQLSLIFEVYGDIWGPGEKGGTCFGGIGKAGG